MNQMPTVTADGRTDGDKRCFYCNEPVGDRHKVDCVRVVKRVRLRLVAEYEVDVPYAWDKGMIEYHRNESSWCKDNLIPELEALADTQGCLCAMDEAVRFECLGDVDTTPREAS